jgi:ribosomal protein L35AE/L33A
VQALNTGNHNAQVIFRPDQIQTVSTITTRQQAIRFSTDHAVCHQSVLSSRIQGYVTNPHGRHGARRNFKN